MQAAEKITNRHERLDQAISKAKNIRKRLEAAGVTDDDIEREVKKARNEVRSKRSHRR
ncbi:MAG: hypothetical protein K9L17_03440 [Clostridiales bacterium]|nr:hypothetical protein [Clostridiales bacterium]MCF8021733.1 hypothetical protein [Clostridiales bacterium]